MNNGSHAYHRSGTSMLAFGILIVLVFTIYSPAVKQEIANHDEISWIQLVDPNGVNTIWDIFSWKKSDFISIGYYAPLTAISFMVDVWIGDKIGSRSFILKLSNIVLHVINVLLVFVIIKKLGYGLWKSFVVASIFALHPLQTGTVAWLAERKNLLMGMFFLISFLTYLKYRSANRAKWFVVSLLAYCLSLAAKPSAVALGPCLVLTDWLLIDEELQKRSFLRATPFLIIGVIWTLAAVVTEGSFQDPIPLWERLSLIPHKIGFMAQKFFQPFDLTHIYPPPEVVFYSLRSWIPGLILITALCIPALIKNLPISRLLLWGIGFWMINIIPSLGIVPFKGMSELYVADHYQYIAVIGLGFSCVMGLDYLIQYTRPPIARAMSVVLVAAVLTFCAALTSNHLKIWNNPETLWLHVLNYNPQSHTAHYNYAHYLDDQERFQEAEAEYQKAIRSNNQAYQPYNNLGVLMMKMGRLSEAIRYFEKCLELNPSFGDPHLSLAKIYFFQQDYDKAVQNCDRAAKLGAQCNVEALNQAINNKRELESGRNEIHP